MSSPKISIIIPTYNGSRYIRNALDSVISQSFRDFECIVIDDASTDGVSQIVESYVHEDPRFRLIRNEKNMERSWSKNHGVNESRSLYIAFLDDDDSWEETKLERQVALLEQSPNIGIVGTYARFVDEGGNLVGETTHLQLTPEAIQTNILISNQFIQSSVLMRKEVFHKAGGFPVDMNLCEDYDLWLRILSISEGENIPEFLVKYRVRTSSTTAKNIYRMKWQTLRLVWRFRTHFPRAYRAILFKIVTFPFDISQLLKVWKKLKY